MNNFDIIIVRHGETFENKDGILQGQLDTTLNENGIEQAKLISRKLQHRNISKIYSSSLNRARETSKQINIKQSTNIIYTDGLKERSYGDFQGQKRNNTFDLRLDYWDLKRPHKTPPNGESLDIFLNRIKHTILKILQDNKNNNENEEILIVTHSGVIIALEYLMKKNNETHDFNSYAISNCEYRIYNSYDLNTALINM